MFSQGKWCIINTIRGLETGQAEASLSPIAIDTAPVSGMQSSVGSTQGVLVITIIRFARGGGWSSLTPGWNLVPSGRSSVPISLVPRWSCHPTRKPFLYRTRVQMGAQHHPHTQRCDARQAPALCWEGRSCLAIRFSALVAPAAGVKHLADLRTTRLCPPRWPAFPMGPGRCSQLGQLKAERLLESLGHSVQQPSAYCDQPQHLFKPFVIPNSVGLVKQLAA